MPSKVEESVMLSVKVESLPTKISPSSSISTPLRLITALVLVTWKRCPDLLTNLPPVIEKLDVLSAASPDCD